jgi:hypothetical protein
MKKRLWFLIFGPGVLVVRPGLAGNSKEII